MPSALKTLMTAAVLHLENDTGSKSVDGELIVAADGIHSAIRKQMYPDEGAPIWNGAVLWRGTTNARPFRTGASMALAGHDSQRIVVYPISAPDPDIRAGADQLDRRIACRPCTGMAQGRLESQR